MFRKKKRGKTELLEEDCKRQAEEAASHIKPKVTCSKGCSGKGYMWNAVSGAADLCKCVLASLRKFYREYKDEHGVDHPLVDDPKRILMAWASLNVKRSPRADIIRAKQQAKEAKKRADERKVKLG